MTKRQILIIGIGLFVLLGLFQGCGAYNTFVGEEEKVKQAWANLQSAYQRRADLIPNLVETVKGAADFERSTLREVIEARARATSIQINPEKLSAEDIQRFSQLQNALSKSLGRLLLTVERYPELKANKNFLELQAQLEGTENRIKVARDRYNQAVQAYNALVRKFPENIYATIFGFGAKPYFEAEEGAQEAPKVEF